MSSKKSCVEAETNSGSDDGDIDSRETNLRRVQFTCKQRMDMYAFCVLELEMHSNKVSIKKQQQAIQRVLNAQQRASRKKLADTFQQLVKEKPSLREAVGQQASDDPNQCIEDDGSNQILDSPAPENLDSEEVNKGDISEENGSEEKTLLQLQEELATKRKTYSDYQKTQVLTSSMLRDVQKRFAKYYPNSAIPSRTTIKHIFTKCVAHGTVENIKTPRRSTRLTEKDEIEQLLIHKPHLSLRQLAQKLNVSTGTVSRRCKALGLIPYSVTLKHQQLATARRQKQMKQIAEGQSSTPSTASTTADDQEQ